MTNTLEIRAPADQTEGTRSQILRWLKTVGESVAEHEPLIEIETDKVTVEVAAPAAGVLREIVKGEQEEIAPGDVLGRMEIAALDVARAGGESDLLADQTGAVAGTQGGANLNGDAVRNDLAKHGKPVHAGAQAPKEPAAAAPGIQHPTPNTTSSSSHSASSATTRSSPAVRRLIAERGLDASTIQGTGEGGRITVDDVLAQGAPNASATSSPAGAQFDASATSPLHAQLAESATPVQSHAQPAASAPASRTIPHTPIRKRIATHMVQSLLQTAPHVTTVFEADLTAIQNHRAANRSDFDSRGAALTLTAYFVAATVNAIRAVPEANSRWTDTALELYDDINIGVATAIEGTGLVVPVLKHVEALDLFGIASHLNRLVVAARDGKLDPSDVRGGTFTISNHGVSGSLLATPIVINQPQSAILGIGKLEKRPVVVEHGGEERWVSRPKCYVTLTIDHRVMDGHRANHFLQAFVRTLESWPAT